MKRFFIMFILILMLSPYQTMPPEIQESFSFINAFDE